MSSNHPVILGIDTSNYKTSVALVDKDGQILCNIQQYLEVKKGERGLRQSAALFQHVNNLPNLMEQAFEKLPKDAEIAGVSYSAKPRPVEGSYMPVFNAGASAARSIAAALKVPVFSFSHQEGHIEAVKYYSEMKDCERFISFHFSGGTTEALLVEDGQIEIIGGSKDLAFGQVIDRTGVAMGLDFPCGEEMDKKACAAPKALTGDKKNNLLPKIKCPDGYINLSGLETKCQRTVGQVSDEELIVMLFNRISEGIADVTRQLAVKYDIKDILFAGGVSSSAYIRKKLSAELKELHICFGEPALSTDNAVGTAILGGYQVWR